MRRTPEVRTTDWDLPVPRWPDGEPHRLLANLVLLVRARFGAAWPVLLAGRPDVRLVHPAVDLEHDLVTALAAVPPEASGPGPVEGAIVVGSPDELPDDMDVDTADTVLWADGGRLRGWTRTTAGDPALGEHVAAALTALVSTPDARIGAISVLTAAEDELLRHTWNAPQHRYPETTLHGLFRAQAARTADAVALRSREGSLTYACLDHESDLIAARLAPLVSEPGQPVVLSGERDLELFTWILGVFKSGAAFVYLDPGLPSTRAHKVIELTAPTAVLSTHSGHPVAQRAGTRLRPPGDVAPDTARPDTTAYIIFTSGSTGEPKGVLRPHRMHTSRIFLEQAMYNMGPGDRHLLKSAISFREFIWPLATGGTCVIAEPGRDRDDRYLAELIDTEGITAVSFVPSLLRLVVAQPAFRAARALRHVFTGGEALRPDLESAVRALGFPVHNTYTLSEADYVCHRDGPVSLEPGDKADAAIIGKPLDMTVYLCDEAGRLVPPGVVGEIRTGGPGLSDGYLGRPELTAERFVPNTIDADGPPLLLRTGDLARWRSDGQLEYLGRADSQVKVRGHRVEPAEVEVTLRQHPLVDDAAVVGVTEPNQGAVLACYVVAGGAEPTVEQLRTFLRERLPDFMVPTYIALVPALPLLDSGKVDRARLSVAARIRPDLGHNVVAPTTDAQRRAVAVIAGVLGLDTVGVDDDFFALGGDSLRLMLLRGAVEAETGVPVDLADVLAAGTPRGLAELLGAEHRPTAGPSAGKGIEGKRAAFARLAAARTTPGGRRSP
jgi:amino acid adenylation domain-containing protein